MSTILVWQARVAKRSAAEESPALPLRIECPSAASGEMDSIAADGSTAQDEMFQMIGKPFTDSCLAGYNGSIFAYGQTGSGKTFTMQGPELDVAESGSAQRGLIPRALEYLFDKIAQKTAGGKVLRRRPHD